MKRGLLIGLLGTAALLFLGHVCAPAQFGIADKASQTEVNIVLRISRKLIDELTTKKFSRVDPIHLYIIDTPIDGVALTDATFRVQFDTSAKESAFTLHLEGTTRGSTVGSRSRVQVLGSSQLDFVVRKRVTFDGLKYRGDPTQVSARFHPTVDSIVTPRGLIGLVLRHYALREIHQRQPLVAEIGFDNGRGKLTELFDTEAAKLLDELNQVSPLQETVRTLFPETRDWIFYLSTTPTHLVIGTGPRERVMPVLPVTDKTEAPIELWIRGKQETQGMLKVMKIWKDAGKTLDTLLPGELGKAIKPDEAFKTVLTKEWIVIQLGTTGKGEQPKEQRPTPTTVARPPINSGPTMLPPADFKGFASAPGKGVSPSVPGPVIWRPISKQTPDVIWRPAATGNPTQLPLTADPTPDVLPRRNP